MSDTARVLMTVGLLSASATGFFTWQISRLDVLGPQRLIALLRLARWTALLLAGAGAVSIGLAVAQEGRPSGAVEVAIGVAFLLLGGLVLHREPREALLIAAGGFASHALVGIAHRPGLLGSSFAPRWYAVGIALFDLYLAALCYWARRL